MSGVSIVSFEFLFAPVRGADHSPQKFRHDIRVPIALASFSFDDRDMPHEGAMSCENHVDASTVTPLTRLRRHSPELLINGHFESAWILVSDVQNALMSLAPEQLRRFSIQAADWMIMAATAAMSSRYEQAAAWCKHSIRVGSASPVAAADALRIYGICMSGTLLNPTAQQNAVQILQSAYQQHLAIGAKSAAITDLCSMAVVELNSAGWACAEATLELAEERLHELNADDTAQAIGRFITAFRTQCKTPRTESKKAICAG
jgi:hypothetical protein